MRKRCVFGLLVGAAMVIGAIPAQAGFFTVPLPDTQYTSSTALLSFADPDGSAVAAVTDGTLTVALPGGVIARTVPGGGWATWGSPPFTEGSTPRVLQPGGSTVTLTFSVPVKVFGLETEPNPFSFQCISAHFFNGSTLVGVVARNVGGNAGALLAAGSTDQTFTSVVITSTVNFAFGRLRYSTTFYHPTPHTIHGHIASLPSGHLGAFETTHHGAHGHTLAASCPPLSGHTSLLLTGEPAEETLFSSDAMFSGISFVAALNEDGTRNGDPGAQNDLRFTARRGAVVQLFGSAAGLSVRDDRGLPLAASSLLFTPPASGSSLYYTTSAPEVSIAGVNARVLFSGLAPGLTGVWQINVLVPDEVRSGGVPVEITYDGRKLKSIDIEVR